MFSLGYLFKTLGQLQLLISIQFSSSFFLYIKEQFKQVIALIQNNIKKAIIRETTQNLK